MNYIKQATTTAILLGVIMMGVSSANAGIIVNYRNTEQPSPCSQPNKGVGNKVDNGIIVNLTGIIVNFTGIIVNLIDGDSDAPKVDCGIIVN